MKKIDENIVAIIFGVSVAALALVAGNLPAQAPVQPAVFTSQITVDTNHHLVTFDAGFFAANVDTLLPAVTGATPGTNGFVQQYQLNTISNLMAIATNTLLADIQVLQGTTLTNGGTNFSLVAQSTTNNTAYLTVSNSATMNSATVTNNLAAGSVTVVNAMDSGSAVVTNNLQAGSLTVNHDTTMAGILTVVSNIISGHFGGAGVSPPVLSAGAGAGTSPTISLSASASDAAGYVTILAGTSPQFSSTVFTVTFNKAYATAPVVILEPVNANARVLGGQSGVWMDQPTATINSFQAKIGTTAITNATTYIWAYHVIQ